MHKWQRLTIGLVITCALLLTAGFIGINSIQKRNDKVRQQKVSEMYKPLKAFLAEHDTGLFSPTLDYIKAIGDLSAQESNELGKKEGEAYYINSLNEMRRKVKSDEIPVFELYNKVLDILNKTNQEVDNLYNIDGSSITLREKEISENMTILFGKKINSTKQLSGILENYKSGFEEFCRELGALDFYEVNVRYKGFRDATYMTINIPKWTPEIANKFEEVIEKKGFNFANAIMDGSTPIIISSGPPSNNYEAPRILAREGKWSGFALRVDLPPGMLEIINRSQYEHGYPVIQTNHYYQLLGLESTNEKPRAKIIEAYRKYLIIENELFQREISLPQLIEEFKFPNSIVGVVPIEYGMVKTGVPSISYQAVSNPRVGISKQDSKEFSDVGEVDPKQGPHYNNMGLNFLKSNDTNAAIKSFKQATKANPGNSEYWNNLGYTYQRLGDFEASNLYCRKSLDITPNRSSALGNMAYNYVKLGQNQKAIESWTRHLNSFGNEASRTKAAIFLRKMASNDQDQNIKQCINQALVASNFSQ